MIVDTAHGHDVGEFHQPLVWPKVTAGFCREPAASVAAVSSSPSCRSAAWHLLDILRGSAVWQQGTSARPRPRCRRWALKISPRHCAPSSRCAKTRHPTPPMSGKPGCGGPAPGNPACLASASTRVRAAFSNSSITLSQPERLAATERVSAETCRPATRLRRLGWRHERSVLVLIHRGLDRNETSKPGRVRPWRRLGFPYPCEMDDRECVVRCAKDHGIAALAFCQCCKGKTVQFMACGDLCCCLSLQRPSGLAFWPKPGLAEVS